MTNQSLAVLDRKTALLVSNSEAEIKEAARKLMRLTPNGSRLTTDQATDLAVYSFLTGLNPFNNECYYMEKVGPVPGIAGYRSKAIEWLRATNPRYTFSPRTWEEYRPATVEEADFNPDAGDIAWVCILKDSISSEAWDQRVMQLGIAYSKMGATFQEAHDTAVKDAGECPHWTSVGVVKADEHFSGNVWRNNVKIEGEYKPEMWDRNERAKKRAAKGCYRKAFPSVNVPDREEGDIIDAEIVELKNDIVEQLKKEEKEQPKQSQAEIMRELGYDTPKSADMRVSDTTPEQVELPIDTEKPAPIEYTGNLATLGGNKGHKYPALWAREIMSNLGKLGVNEYKADYVLQNLMLPADTAPDKVIEAINLYLMAEGKEAK